MNHTFPEKFIPGKILSERFYWEVVRPVLDAVFPSLAHGAALLGTGSEVLGFDTPMSMDHDWYPRVLIFLRDEDAGIKMQIREVLAERLPHVFKGLPVDKVESVDEPGTHHMRLNTEGLVNHSVFPVTLREFAWEWLAWDIDQPLSAVDWLNIPSQVLLSMTAGAVYYDGLGELATFRQALSWYPHDVWLYLLAAGWWRLGEEEHLMPRAGDTGDELGSRIIAGRLARGIMDLCYLMERVYAPYPKWFGSGFKQLACAGEMLPLLERLAAAEDYQSRQKAYCAAGEMLAVMHNRLALTKPLPAKATPFWGRPWDVMHGEVFAKALRAQIVDAPVMHLAKIGLIGNIDQVSDNTEVKNRHWRAAMARVYRVDE